MSADRATVTIVVPTRGRPHELRTCVESLARVARGSSTTVAITVVDNDPEHPLTGVDASDGSEPTVTVLRERAVGASSARNRGLAAATTQLVVFVDDDVVVTEGWLEALIAPFADPSVVATVGPIELAYLAPRPRWLTENVGCWYSALDLGAVTRPLDVSEYGWGANLAVRRAAAVEVGGFDRRLGPGTAAPFGDDVDFLDRLRVTGTIVYAAPAGVRHRIGAHRLRRGWLARRAYRQGLTTVALACKGGLGERPRPVRALGAFAGILVRGFRQGLRTARDPARRPSLVAEQVAIRSMCLGAGVGWLRWHRRTLAGPSWSLHEGAGTSGHGQLEG